MDAEVGIPNTILSIKWGKAFGATDVNMLYRASKHHTSNAIRFVCLTDDVEGIDPAIETRPIPDIGLNASEWKHPGVWGKLSLFSPTLSDLGRILFLDLDMMIMGDLTPFFVPIEGATFQNMGDSWHRNPRSDQKIPGTCIYAYNPSDEPQVLKTFLEDKTGHMKDWRNEQEFVGAHVLMPHYWTEGHVISFKRHLCHRNGKGLFVKTHAPPLSTRVVAFHGTPRPAEVMSRKIWGLGPHWHLGGVSWIADYFRRFGDE